MAERRALLLVPVDAFLHRVDVEERHRVLAGQQRRAAGQVRQQQPAHLLQLEHVPPGERAQERSQRGRRADPAEQRRHRAVPQQVHVIDAVRPGDHPGGQAGHLQVRVHPAPAADPDMLCRPGPPGPPAAPAPSPGPGPPATRDSGHQTSHGSSPAHATIALARCPLQLDDGSFSNSHRPSSEGTFRVDAPARNPIYAVGWPAGISPAGSHRSRRDSLPSPGSYHLVHQTRATEGTHIQCANRRGYRSVIPRQHSMAFFSARSRLYFLRIQRTR